MRPRTGSAGMDGEKLDDMEGPVRLNDRKSVINRTIWFHKKFGSPEHTAEDPFQNEDNWRQDLALLENESFQSNKHGVFENGCEEESEQVEVSDGFADEDRASNMMQSATYHYLPPYVLDHPQEIHNRTEDLTRITVGSQHSLETFPYVLVHREHTLMTTKYYLPLFIAIKNNDYMLLQRTLEIAKNRESDELSEDQSPEFCSLLNKKDFHGNTPLMLAIQNACCSRSATKLVKSFLRFECNLKAENNKGFTALDYAGNLNSN